MLAMKQRKLRLIAHRVPGHLVERLHQVARTRRQTLQKTLADAIAGLVE